MAERQKGLRSPKYSKYGSYMLKRRKLQPQRRSVADSGMARNNF